METEAASVDVVDRDTLGEVITQKVNVPIGNALDAVAWLLQDRGLLSPKRAEKLSDSIKEAIPEVEAFLVSKLSSLLHHTAE